MDRDEHLVESKARELCFKVCSTGGFLDFEAGCCSVCRSPEECQGWRTFAHEARKDVPPITSDSTRIAELEAALKQCQRTLEILIDPKNKGSGIDNMAAWASCVASEARARKALEEAS